MKKNLLKLIIAVLAVNLLLPLHTINAQESTFTYAIDGDPFTMNPITADDRWGLTHTNTVYSPLARIEGDGTMKFELAESMEVAEDGLSIDVKLRQDVKWHDGEAFTADDVVFSYTVKADKDNGNADALWIGDEPIVAEKVDDYNVKFVLPDVSAAALSNLLTEVYLIPEHVHADEPDFTVGELTKGMIGTGPYKFVEYKRGEYIQYEANPDYYDGAPGINTVIFRIIPNADTRKVALQTGEVDASFITVNDIQDFDQEQINIYSYSENRVGYIGLNMNSDNFQEENARKAVMFALNKEELNLAAYQDPEFFELAHTFLPPQNPFYTDQVEKYDRDVEKAKSLLEEAGITDLTINLAFSSNVPEQNAIATFAQQQLAEAGITLELVGTDASAMFAELLTPDSKEYDMFIGGYIMGNDPDLYSPLFTQGGSANFFQLESDEVDELFAKGAVELDEATRLEIYHELQAVMADIAFMYPYTDNKKIMAINKRIGGVEEAKFVPIYSFEDLSKLIIQE